MSSFVNLESLISERGANCRGADEIVNNEATRILTSQLEHSQRSKKVNIRNKLSVAECDAFRARYGGAFDVNLTHEYTAPHSLAGALRVAEHFDCIDSFPPEDKIIDFGGSWLHHYSRGDNRVHSCCPILGPRDATRHEERMCRLRKMVQTSDRFVEVPDFCLNKAEDCNVQADWAICIHGGYDMGFQGLCKAMNAHGTRILQGTIMFDGAMLFDRQGELPLLQCRWQRVGTGSKEKIKFDFINESTLSYVHDWKNLGSFLTESSYTIGGTTYLLERMLLKCSIMTYKIIATNVRCPPETLRHCIWFENISQYLAVQIPVGYNLNDWRTVRVARATVREVEEISFRCFKENKDWTENMRSVASILSAKSSTVIINGQSIMSGERLDVLEYHLVAFSLTLNLYQKYEKLRNFQGELEWKGWANHFKTRLWWCGRTVSTEGGFFRNFLADRLPWLKLNTYADSLDFITRISEVESFEVDSVPTSRLRSFFQKEENIVERAASEIMSANARRIAKKAEMSKEFDDFVDAPEDLAPEDVVEDVINTPVAQDVKPCQSKSETARSIVLDPDAVLKNGAIDEFADYSKRLHENTVSNLRHLWTLMGCRGNEIHNKSVAETYHRVDDMVNVHFPNGHWMYPLKYEYTVGYNDGGLGEKFENELYVVDKTCSCANAKAIADACKKVSAPTCSVVMVDGVAGCGKTTAIKETFRFEKDIIVTANRKSAEDVRKAIFGDASDSEVALKVVRTADSAIMHGLPECHRLLVDEAGLLHYGQLLAVAGLCKCSEVLAFGDTEQISFKSRDATFRMKYCNIEYDKRDIVSKTFRCPQDVVSAVKILKRKCANRSSKYNGWVSSSKVEKSLSKSRIVSINQVSMEKHKFYLTMTQADKAALCSRAKDVGLDKTWVESNIKTVHEAQGISVDHVVLVRLKSTKCDLFKSEEYCLVALTRHKKTFEYLYNGDLGGDLISFCVT
nr:replicatioin protein 1a [Broad bean mottle virus]